MILLRRREVRRRWAAEFGEAFRKFAECRHCAYKSVCHADILQSVIILAWPAVIVWWAVKIQAEQNKTDIQEEGQKKKNVQAQER